METTAARPAIYGAAQWEMFLQSFTFPLPTQPLTPAHPTRYSSRRRKITAINGTHGRPNDTNQVQQDLKMPVLIEDGDARSVLLYVHRDRTRPLGAGAPGRSPFLSCTTRALDGDDDVCL